MTIGIIGSGAIGTAFARTLARAGVEATISNSRGPASLNELAQELSPSIKAGTREEAARADIVFIAVNWTKPPARSKKSLRACWRSPATSPMPPRSNSSSGPSRSGMLRWIF